MKNFTYYLFLLLFFIPEIGYNQVVDTMFKKQKIPWVYIEGELGYSKGLILGISGNIILPIGYGLNIGYSHYNRESQDLPLDYDPGLCFDFIHSCIPVDKLFIYNFRLAKRFETRAQMIRFKIEIGLSMIQYEQVHFHSVGKNGTLLGSNYYESYSSYHNIGISFRGVSEFPFSQITGLQVAVLGTYSSRKSFLGIEVGMHLGYLRDRLRNRKMK